MIQEREESNKGTRFLSPRPDDLPCVPTGPFSPTYASNPACVICLIARARARDSRYLGATMGRREKAVEITQFRQGSLQAPRFPSFHFLIKREMKKESKSFPPPLSFSLPQFPLKVVPSPLPFHVPFVFFPLYSPPFFRIVPCC